MKIKTIILFAILTILSITILPLLAQGVGGETTTENATESTRPTIPEDELRGPRANFLNRSTRRATDTRRNLDTERGQGLATTILGSENTAQEGTVQVLRIFNSKEKGYGADVFRLTDDSRYGHINSIQRVIAGYLMSAFEYNESQGMLLARFILDYNARVRTNPDLQNKYSSGVLSSTSETKRGIALSFTDWPGKTEILIPLKKNVVRPDKTDMITDEVIEDSNLSEDDKKEAEQIKEERKQEDEKRIEEKKEELKKEEETLQNKEEQNKQQQQETGEEKKKTEEKIEELKKDPEKNKEEIKKEEEKKEDLTKQEEALKEEQQQIQDAQEENQQEQQEIAEQEQQTSGDGEDATGNQGEAEDGKESGATKEEIAAIVQENQELKEEKQEREQKSENVVGDKILFLRVLKYIQGGHYNNELWQLDPINDDTLHRGPYDLICGREFLPIKGRGILVIGYEPGEHIDDKHHLIMLNEESLRKVNTTVENIFWRSPMIFKDDMIYAIEIFHGQYYLSRFNPEDLLLDARSKKPISPNSDITFFNNKIYVTGKSVGQDQDLTSIMVFQRKDLEHMKTIDPKEGGGSKTTVVGSPASNNNDGTQEPANNTGGTQNDNTENSNPGQ